MTFFTDAGDSGVLLPMSLVCAATLWLFHSQRLAWLLLRSVILAGVVIAVLKVFFLSCGAHWQPGLISPSGHACLSAVVYGTMGTVASAGRPALVRAAITALVALLIGAITISRVALGIHTWTEVIVGLSVGILAQLLFAWSFARMQPPRVDLKTFGVALMTTVMVAFGIRIPAESFIRHIARHVGENCEIVDADRYLRVVAVFRRDWSAGAPPQPVRSRAITSSASSRAD